MDGSRCSLGVLWLLLIATHILIHVVASTKDGTASPKDSTWLNCDFDNVGTCNWTRPGGNPELQWLLKQGSSDPGFQQDSFPSSDHTTGIGFGAYALASCLDNSRNSYNDPSSANVREQREATLISPRIEIPPSGVCLDFWYFMAGNNSGRLEVEVTVESGFPSESEWRLAWMRKGSQGADWKNGHVFLERDVVNVNGDDGVVVRFTAKGGLGGSGNACTTITDDFIGDVTIALDDIKASIGPCVTSYSCDFDFGFWVRPTCDFTQSTSDELEWRIGEEYINHNEEDDNVDEFDTKVDESIPQCCNDNPDPLQNDSIRCMDNNHINQRRNDYDNEVRRKGNRFLTIHTSGDSHQTRPGDRAVLMSPMLTGNTPVCISFMYLIEGPGSLEVFLSPDTVTKVSDTNVPSYAIYNKTNIQSSDILHNDTKETRNNTNIQLNDTDFALNNAHVTSNDTSILFNNANGILNNTDGKSNDIDDNHIKDLVNSFNVLINDIEAPSNDSNVTSDSTNVLFNDTNVSFNDTNTRSKGTHITYDSPLNDASVSPNDTNTRSKGTHITYNSPLNDASVSPNHTNLPPNGTNLLFNGTINFLLNDTNVLLNDSNDPLSDTNVTPSNEVHNVNLANKTEYYANMINYRNRNISVWSQSGKEKVGRWNSASIHLRANETPYRLVFQGTIEPAMDRVLIWLDSIEMTLMYRHDANHVMCDFEDESTCPWIFDAASESRLSWVRTMGDLKEPSVHVRTDHTLGSRFGKYLLLQRNDKDATTNEISRGRVTSPLLKPDSSYCLEFWYVIVGESGEIQVINEEDKSTNASFPEMKLRGPQTSFWTLFKSTLKTKSTPGRARLVIEGIIDRKLYNKDTDDDDGNGILLDDLTLRFGTCETLISDGINNNGTRKTKRDKNNNFRCSDGGLSLSQPEVCDFHHDCPDGEEEKACGYSCSFERDDCRWSASSNEANNWNRTSRAELPGTLGAKMDHTTGKQVGRFLYLLDLSITQHVLVANLTSPILRKSSPSCQLSFFINPLYSDNWKISVYKITSTRKTRVLSISKLIPSVWQKITAFIGFSREPFRVQIVSERISMYISCIALDDISFDDCDFPKPSGGDAGAKETEFTCQNGAVLDPSRLCDFSQDCRGGYDERESLCSNYARCDFEKDMCGWKQDYESDDFDWLRQRVSVSISQAKNTGPDFDHTTDSSSGFVLQMTRQNRLPGDKAWLLSPILSPSSKCRMSLYVYLFGADVDRFNVYIRHAQGGPLTRHVSTLGEVGQVWIHKAFVISSPSPFQIVVEAIKGYGELVDIAIDDISLSPECIVHDDEFPKVKPTPLVPSSQCRDENQWPCRDSTTCINRHQVCDFTSQCPDQSDEMECGSCDFESSFCGWEDVSRGRVVWKRVNSHHIDDKRGRKRRLWDHTLKDNGSGWYAMATDIGYDYTRIAFLLSPELQHTSPSCTLTFYYVATRQSGIELMLFSQNATRSSFEYAQDGIRVWRSEDLLRQSSRHSFIQWSKVSVNIGNLAGGFRLMFIHRRIVHLPEVVFAIDDISLSPSCWAENLLSACAPNEFRCYSNAKCTSEHSRCDFVTDCPDGEDEAGCEYNHAYKMAGFRYSKEWFLNDRTSDFKWKRWSGNTRTKEKRPRWDLDEKSWSGRYLYMASSPRSSANKKAQKSRIRSYVIFPTPRGDCFMRLFYQSAGDPRGEVQIYTLPRKKAHRTVLWNMPGGKTSEWKKAIIQLKSNNSFRVFIEGTRKKRYGGGVAIDGISFNRHCFFKESDDPLPPPTEADLRRSCAKDEQLCNGRCVLQILCTHGVYCRENRVEVLNTPTSCTFERGMCNWTQKRWPRFKSPRWRIRSTPKLARTVTTYPKMRKTGDKKVLRAGLGKGVKNMNKHIIISPIYKHISRGCSFSLSYLFLGRILSFSIERRMAGYDQPLYFRNKWSTQISQSGQWNSVAVWIPPCSSDFQIVIKLIMKIRDKNTLFLLDDFNFENCRIVQPSRKLYRNTIPKCFARDFHCADGACALKEGLCDLEYDCCDGSDERSKLCSKNKTFTFESGLEGWANVVGTRYWWEVKDGMRSWQEALKRPSADHTRQSLTGRYLSTSSRPGLADGALLVRRMPTTDGTCQIVFWYNTDCNEQAKCSITLQTKTLAGNRSLGTPLTFNYGMAPSNVWKKGSIQFEVKEPYELIVEGRLDGHRLSTLNLDDFVMGPGCGLFK